MWSACHIHGCGTKLLTTFSVRSLLQTFHSKPPSWELITGSPRCQLRGFTSNDKQTIPATALIADVGSDFASRNVSRPVQTATCCVPAMPCVRCIAHRSFSLSPNIMFSKSVSKLLRWVIRIHLMESSMGIRGSIGSRISWR